MGMSGYQELEPLLLHLWDLDYSCLLNLYKKTPEVFQKVYFCIIKSTMFFSKILFLYKFDKSVQKEIQNILIYF